MPDSPSSTMPPPPQEELQNLSEGAEQELEHQHQDQDRKDKEKHKRDRKEKKKRHKEHRKSKGTEDATTSSIYADTEEDGDLPNVTTDTTYTANEGEPAAGTAALADESLAAPSQGTAPDDVSARKEREAAGEPEVAPAPEPAAAAAALIKKKRGRPSKKDLEERARAAEAAGKPADEAPKAADASISKKSRPSAQDTDEGKAQGAETTVKKKRGRPSKKDLEERAMAAAAAAAATGGGAEAGVEPTTNGASAPTPKKRVGRPSKKILAERAALEEAKKSVLDDDETPLASLPPGAVSVEKATSKPLGRRRLHPGQLTSSPLPAMLVQPPPTGTINVAVLGGPTFSRLASEFTTLSATKDLIRNRLKLEETAPLTLAYIVRGALIDLEDDQDFAAFERKIRALPPWANEEVMIQVKPPPSYKYEPIFPRPPPVPFHPSGSSQRPPVPLESAEKRKRAGSGEDELATGTESGSDSDSRKKVRTDEAPLDLEDRAAVEARYQELLAKGRRKLGPERAQQKELAALLGHKK